MITLAGPAAPPVTTKNMKAIETNSQMLIVTAFSLPGSPRLSAAAAGLSYHLVTSKPGAKTEAQRRRVEMLRSGTNSFEPFRTQSGAAWRRN